MKALLTVLMLVTAPAFAGTACEDYVATMDDILVQTRDRFAVGEVTRTDVADAEAGAIQAKFDCNLATKAQYCPIARQAAEIYRQGIAEEVRVGQRTTADLIAAQKRLFEIRRTCE